MKQEKFILYKDIKKILEDNGFYGFTARNIDKYNITYTFISTIWFKVTITVETLKIGEERVDENKIVLGMVVNKKRINTMKEFLETMKNLYKIQKETK
jgi:TRAP-type uncharacterized transport system substrate-binding protein